MSAPRLIAAAALAAAACSDDAPAGPDAAPLEFTGGYEDWDSTDLDFLGLPDTTVAEVADPTNTATTAPNGRSVLTLPGAGVSEVTFTKDGVVPARYTVAADAVRGPYEVRGITTERIATFFTELGIGAWDPAATLIQIEVRAYPSLDPVDGVTVAVDGAAGGFHKTGAGAWEAGATTTGGGDYVVFPSVAPGERALTITAPAGRACVAPEAIVAVAGENAMTTVWCAD